MIHLYASRYVGETHRQLDLSLFLDILAFYRKIKDLEERTREIQDQRKKIKTKGHGAKSIIYTSKYIMKSISTVTKKHKA